ncbi:chemotaxis protein CheR, partial [Mycobacterium sp. ITM-2017-0098]
FSDSLINSIKLGVVVVDLEMRVAAWNRGCEDMWGLRSGEAVGKFLGQLDIGIPVDGLKPLIGNAFVDAEAAGELSVEAVNRRGK